MPYGEHLTATWERMRSCPPKSRRAVWLQMGSQGREPISLLASDPWRQIPLRDLCPSTRRLLPLLRNGKGRSDKIRDWTLTSAEELQRYAGSASERQRSKQPNIVLSRRRSAILRSTARALERMLRELPDVFFSAISFPVGLLNPLQNAGLARRSPCCPCSIRS